MRKKILILMIVLLNFLFISCIEVKADETLPCIERSKDTCTIPNYGYACVWNETKFGDYCNVDNLMYVTCGDATDIPYQVPGLISFAVNLLKIATPIILIVISIISLLKALTSSNDDEIKKAQKSLIRKIMAAVLVFFVISIVQFIIMKVADDNEKTSISDCLDCFLNNSCEENVYYKTSIGGEYLCTKVGSEESETCETFDITSSSTEQTTELEISEEVPVSCNGEYWNGTQPKSISDGGKCYKLELNGKIVHSTFGSNGERKVITQNFWKANGKCYYWKDIESKYINVPCDTEVATPYYVGKKAESCNGKYWDDGYQPKSISINGTCYELENSGLKHTFETVDLSGKAKISSQTIWKANNKCYYWEGRENQYLETLCM